MKTFINYVKTLINNPNFSIGKPRKNKNGESYFCVFGLDARDKALLAPELQKLIDLGNKVDGYGVNYTPPHKSTSGEGLLYFGPKTNQVDEADFDVFSD
tara:strand:+ start:1828 stop:2124 length:297 start_codon:yes stop_codon:yes gene_type:complete